MNLDPEGWIGMVEKRQEINTGVINPYAFVASRKGRKYDWKNIEAGEKKKLLETVFKCPYHKLFDPQHGSPLFNSRNSPRDTAKFQSEGTGETRCTAAVQNWLPNSAGTFSSPNPPPGINDAVQGCSLNCWFVAALASVAWTWPDYIKTWLAGQCKLRLFKGDPSGTTPPYMPADGTDYTPSGAFYTTGLPLPFGSNGVGDWVCCRPDTPHPNVLWSALFEKAYAKFWQLPDAPADQPYPTKFGTHSPLNALVHLTGKRYYSKLDVDNYPLKNYVRTFFDMVEFSSADDIFDKIYKQCYILHGGEPDVPVAVPAMTRYPMVAWTYPNAAAANAANGVDPVANPEKSAKYTNDSIVSMHSYSVLGVHYISPKKYIVLRNPWGVSIPGAFGGDPRFIDPSPNDPSDDIYYTEMNNAIATGPWTVTPMPSNSNGCLGNPPIPLTIDLGADDGIFALAVDKFRWHFKGFGWVQVQ